MGIIGAIMIGQAPRDDVVPEMEKLLGPGARVLQAGALDGLSRATSPPSRRRTVGTRSSHGSPTAARSSWPSPPFRSPRPVLLPDRLIARFLGELA